MAFQWVANMTAIGNSLAAKWIERIRLSSEAYATYSCSVEGVLEISDAFTNSKDNEASVFGLSLGR